MKKISRIRLKLILPLISFVAVLAFIVYSVLMPFFDFNADVNECYGAQGNNQGIMVSCPAEFGLLEYVSEYTNYDYIVGSIYLFGTTLAFFLIGWGLDKQFYKKATKKL